MVFALVAFGLVLYVDSSRSVISSQKAELKTNSYIVGLDFSGVILQQLVKEGDVVQSGQRLFVIKSATLTENINNKNLSANDLLYPLDSEGNVVITSAQAGLVEKVNFQQGSFFPANEELATISDANSVYVSASYKMAPRDFNTISKDSRVKVKLPDGSSVEGMLQSTKVISQSDVVVIEIEAKLEGLNANGFRTLNGTPVTAELTIREDTYINQLKQLLTN